MKRIYVLLIGAVLLISLAAACSKNAEISVRGQHDVTFEYRKN